MYELAGINTTVLCGLRLSVRIHPYHELFSIRNELNGYTIRLGNPRIVSIIKDDHLLIQTPGYSTIE